MSVRAKVGRGTQALLVVFVIFTVISAFEQSAGRGIARLIRFLIVIVLMGSAIAEHWLRALAYMPDGSHGKGFQRAALRLTGIALMLGATVGVCLTTAGRRLPGRPVWGLVVLVRDLSFWMFMFHAGSVYAWSALMRALQRPLK